ncbi:hypothetical protein LQZ18_06435 [Lachnospiraceae bacterium ZAX-1]
MKLKYYFRGLAVGIMVTVVIMAISFSGRKEDLTNLQIIERAKELGMVVPEEINTDTDNIEKAEDEENTKAKEADGEADIPADTTNQADGEPDATSQQQEADTQEAEDALPEEGFVPIEILPGEYSDKVSQKLFDAGLIKNAETFNRYMVDTEADNELHVGAYSIPIGSTEEEIIAILTAKPSTP